MPLSVRKVPLSASGFNHPSLTSTATIAKGSRLETSTDRARREPHERSAKDKILKWLPGPSHGADLYR